MTDSFRRGYSRLAKVEERKNKKTAFFYVFLSIVFIVFLGFFGFKVLGAVTKLIANVNSDETIDLSSDTTPPPPPRLNSVPTSTNQTNINIGGSAEPESAVTIHYNNQTKNVTASPSGEFSTNIDLNKGENTLYAISTDLTGNESNKSQVYIITYDNEPPKVEIITPKDGASFAGSKQKQLTLEGVTEADAKVTINDRVSIVDSSGKFKFPTTLGTGDNSFNIKSTDKAGNLTEMTIHVNFAE